MDGFNFTQRVRKVLAAAREESARLRHEYVGTEHMLLALLRESGGVSAAVLQGLDVDTEAVRLAVEGSVKEGRGERTGFDLPYTSRAKKVLELGMSEARELGHHYVGSEHLLIGLLREEKGIAAQVLRECGASVEAVRAETLRLLGEGARDESDQVRRDRSGRPLPYRASSRRGTPGTLPSDAANGAWYYSDASSDEGGANAQATSPLGQELAEAQLLDRLATARRIQAEAERLEEETTWLRVRSIVDLCVRLETPIRLEVGPGAGLTLLIADVLRISVPSSVGPGHRGSDK